ncbi:tRNA lysidine(34) synthetase TilS [Kineobactrum salinum]|uniref:tRNA(Ile)-lysidine synthase n=1 Tax=Kineobactrum salinum TaxID=2708301 RepID=A0A6C0TXH9_9GAMM|nr:tRNA lysidine(34) synthetase TilS [Kineobactrum salinum]QIB64233.1 tRNA lysidine(34) synthetase TilS [Kineobactrum salinum]
MAGRLQRGLDSTVLLHLLHCHCREQAGAPALVAVHINHQLQPASTAWEQHCERVCDGFGLPLLRRQVEVAVTGEGTESAARKARYRALAQLLEPGDVIFLAHHQDDQMETVLLRLLRGAGLQGLQGMPGSRPLGAGTLQRPLLDYPRSALQRYAREQALEWIDDPSNTDTRFDRNYLRHEIVPRLAARWPACRRTITRSAHRLHAAGEVLDELLPRVEPVRSRLGDPGLALPPLLQLPVEAGLLVLRRWLRQQQLPMPDQAQLAEFLRQLHSGLRRGARLDCGRYRLQRFADALYLVVALPPAAEALAELRLTPATTVALPTGGQLALIPAGDSPGLRLRTDERLTLRWRQGGERCRLAGRGGSRSLKKLLQEAAIPPWWRQRLPLLYLDEELLAVADLWLCDSSRLALLGGQGAWRPLWTRNTSGPAD